MNARQKIQWAVVVVAVAIIAGVGFWYATDREPLQQEKAPLKIGIDVFPGWGHAFIAQEQDLFRLNGVDVEIVLNEDYLTIQDMYAKGELDGAFMVFADAIYNYDQGVKGQVVYVSDHSITGDVIAARPDIKSLEELRGKTISVEGINSFSHLFVLSALEKNGMKEGDVFIKNVGAQEVIAAIESNEIVAGHTYGPEKVRAKGEGYNFLAYAGDVPGIITDTLVFNEQVIKDRPDDVKAVVKAMYEAKAFQEENLGQAVEIIAANINDKPDSVRIGIEAVDHIDLERSYNVMHLPDSADMRPETDDLTHLFGSFNKISDFYLDRGQIFAAPKYDSIVDVRFVSELLSKVESCISRFSKKFF